MNRKNAHICLLVFCVMFFVYQYGLRSAIPSVLNEDLQKYFSINAFQMGSLISLFYLAYTAMQIPVGLIIDRVKPKWIAIAAFSLFSAGILAFVSSQSYFVAALAQIFLGCSSSFAFVLVMKVTNDYFPPHKVALVSSIAISAGSLGPVIGSPALAYLSSIFFWKNVVIYASFIGFALSILGFALLRHEPINTLSEITSVPESRMSLKDSLKIITKDYQFIWIGIFSMMMLGPLSGFSDAWGISFVRHIYGYNKEQAAFAVSLVYLGTIVGGPLMAHFSERLKSYKKVMVGGSLAFLGLFSLITFVKLPLIGLYTALFLIGVIVSCQFLSFPAALVSVPKEIGATLTGIVNMITMLGSTILIPCMGIALDWSKGSNQTYSETDYIYGMCVLLLAIIIAIAVTPLIKDRYPESK